MSSYHRELLDYIASGGGLDDEHKARLAEAVGEFTKKFTGK